MHSIITNCGYVSSRGKFFFFLTRNFKTSFLATNLIAFPLWEGFSGAPCRHLSDLLEHRFNNLFLYDLTINAV